MKSQSSDNKIDTTCARISNGGSFTSGNYFTGLQVLSFYVAVTASQGSYSYSVNVSDNGTQWTQVFTQSKPGTTMQMQSVDLQTRLQTGLALASGAVANMSTPLKIQFTFTSNKPKNPLLLDNINFSCLAVA